MIAARVVVRIAVDETQPACQDRRERVIGWNRLASTFIQLLRAYAPQQEPVIAVLDDDANMIGPAIAGVQDRLPQPSGGAEGWPRASKTLDALLPVLVSARGVDRRLPGGARRPPRQGRAEPVAGRDHAADGGVAIRLRAPGRSATSRRDDTCTSGRTGSTCRRGWKTDAECMLVLIGATPEGKKELVGFQTGVRESAQTWRELLIDIKRRGLEDRAGPCHRRWRARLLEGNRRSSRAPGTSAVGFTRPPTC